MAKDMGIGRSYSCVSFWIDEEIYAIPIGEI